MVVRAGLGSLGFSGGASGVVVEGALHLRLGFLLGCWVVSSLAAVLVEVVVVVGDRFMACTTALAESDACGDTTLEVEGGIAFGGGGSGCVRRKARMLCCMLLG